jgi:Tfp pilus assembly pilus retraction ATPase PilT
MVLEQTRAMFKEGHSLEAPDVLVLYEQRILPKETLDDLIEKFYKDYEFYSFNYSWVPSDVASYFKDTDFVPMRIDYGSNSIIVGTLPEYSHSDPPIIGTYKIEKKYIKLYEFVQLYVKLYGTNPPFILPIAARDLFNMIVKEAITLNAADITISQHADRVEIYYNVGKRKVYSNRTVPKDCMDDIVKMLAADAGHTITVDRRKPIYFTLNLDEGHRGRTVINYKYNGYVISIRVLSNELHKNTFNDLNIPQDVQDFLYKYYVYGNTGLKLMCGPTYSGKNTTIITILDEIHKHNDCKIVSVENPVEILTDYIEQIDAETEDEFVDSVNSLLRQNPDLVYIAEMTDKTGVETMKVANTGKSVLSTIHCNSVAEVVSRLIDLTSLPISTIIQILDSVVYQELIPKKCPICGDEGCPECYKAGVVPIFSYAHLTPELKRVLVDQDLSSIYKTLSDHTQGLDNLKKLYNAGIISKKTYERRGRVYD